MPSPQLIPNADIAAMPEKFPELKLELASTKTNMPSTNGVQITKANTTEEAASKEPEPVNTSEEAAKESGPMLQKGKGSSPTEGENKRQHTGPKAIRDSKDIRVSDVYRPNYGGSPSPRNLGRYQQSHRTPHELDEAAIQHGYNEVLPPM